MTSQELTAAQAIIANQIDLLRFGAYNQAQVLQLIDEMGQRLERLLRGSDITTAARARLQSLLKQATEVIDQYYSKLSDQARDTLERVASVEAVASTRAVGAALSISLEASLPPDTFIKKLLTNIMIQGAPSRDWWRRQAADTRFRFMQQVRQGLIAAETNEQIARRIAGSPTVPGIMNLARSNARSLVHASIQTVANESRLETFRRMDHVVKGVRQLSTLDGHTTDICIAYAGRAWDLDGNKIEGTTLPFNGGPPRHWGCRSVLVPITRTFRDLGIILPEVGRISPRFTSVGGPTNMTMRQWIDSRSVEQLDAQLGRGRAKLYRAGKITLQQLLDLKGNPLTLAQLERKYVA